MTVPRSRTRTMERIDSEQNSVVKLARKLLRSQRERRSEQKMLLDGAHLVSAYGERFGFEAAIVLASESGLHSEEIRSLLEMPAGRAIELPDRLFGKLSPVATPSGVMAIAPIPQLQPSTAADPFWLLLDGVQDPGNLGAILRSATATGVTRAVLSTSCADPWSPKCLRGGMGAQFILPIGDHADLMEEIARFPGTAIAAVPRAGKSLFEARLTGPLALIFGGEGAGLSPLLREAARSTIHIPVAGPMESLNVAAAVAIVCYEKLRQELARQPPAAV